MLAMWIINIAYIKHELWKFKIESHSRYCWKDFKLHVAYDILIS